jgi:diguanylate cyclase (GGDEF)-like protein
VNHVRLAPGTPHRLGEGDVLTLGAHRLQFWLGHRTIWEPHLRRHDVSPILAALAAAGPTASLVLLDIDRLYRLNRLHPDGLLAGDAALAQVEALARAPLGAADTFARIGGDRFAIVLPGRGREEAYALAEAVRRAIDEGHPISVTVSVGVASWSPSIGRPWQLLREAEARLTDARVAGRNRVCGA